MRVASQNVKSFPPMPQPHVEHDIWLVASEAGLILWQEVYLDRYLAVVRDLAPHFQTYFPEYGGVPISWNAQRFDLVDSGIVTLNKAQAKVSLRRAITWVILRNRKTGFEFLVHNFHYVAGAWNEKAKYMKAFRKQEWTTGNGLHRDLVKDWVKRGLPVVGGGDANRLFSKFALLSKRVGGQRIHYAAGGIDYLFFIDSKTHGWNVSDVRSGKDRFSDHDGRLATAVLTRKHRKH